MQSAGLLDYVSSFSADFHPVSVEIQTLEIIFVFNASFVFAFFDTL